MRSIIPPVNLEIDLGDGLKTYKLRRTNFSAVALMGIMGSPELASANAALEAQKSKAGDDQDVLGVAFTTLRLDHQCRLIAAQLFGLLQYDHPEIEYRDVLASIPADPAQIGRIGKACMDAWQRGEPPKVQEPESEPDDEDESDPTKGQRGGREKRAPKPSSSLKQESLLTTTTA